MLVLPHTNRFRVNLYQLCQRVHQSSAYGHSTAYGDVVVGKLVPCDFRGRIDGSSLLADDEYLYVAVEALMFQELLRLAAGCSVTYGNGIYLIRLYHHLQLGKCLFLLADRRVGVDVLIVEQISLCIEAHDFTTRTKSGVYTHHTLLPQW